MLVSSDQKAWSNCVRLGFLKVAKPRDVFRTMQGWKLFASQIPAGLDFETTGPTQTLAIPMCSLILKWIFHKLCANS